MAPVEASGGNVRVGAGHSSSLVVNNWAWGTVGSFRSCSSQSEPVVNSGLWIGTLVALVVTECTAVLVVVGCD